MSELLELCSSVNLSFATLQEKINTLGQRISSQDPLCFHKACMNKKVTLQIVQLLYNTLALRSRDNIGQLPIHQLCLHEDLDDTNSLDILRFMLEVDPTLLREANAYDNLPTYLAAKYKSTAFCKVLIDSYPESLRIESRNGWLPIHVACAQAKGERKDTTDTIQYMLKLDPQLINAENSEGYLPIHYAAMNGNTKLIELLLKHDPDAASNKTNNAYRRLPLHLSSRYSLNLNSVQILYDVYPEAILASDGNGDTPLDLEGEQPVIEFLQTQLVYARQAQDMTIMTTVDDNGQLPLHHALKDDNASLGSIKLLVKANPAALQVSDQNGVCPLHIACEFSLVNVVKYLVELAGDTLKNVDANKDSLLHYACHGGNCDIVKYLFERNIPSVSERNNDNKLAINLLFKCGEDILDRESLEYIETVWQLILANPEVVRDFDFQRGCKKGGLLVR